MFANPNHNEMSPINIANTATTNVRDIILRKAINNVYSAAYSEYSYRWEDDIGAALRSPPNDTIAPLGVTHKLLELGIDVPNAVVPPDPPNTWL